MGAVTIQCVCLSTSDLKQIWWRLIVLSTNPPKRFNSELMAFKTSLFANQPNQQPIVTQLHRYVAEVPCQNAWLLRATVRMTVSGRGDVLILTDINFDNRDWRGIIF